MSAFNKFVLQRSSALGISRTEVARRAGISRESLYKLLRGETSNPSIETLHGMAIALNVAPIYLLRTFFDDLRLGCATLLPTLHPNDYISFVRDVSIPDGASVGTNQSIVKTWELQNTGSTPWHNRKLVCQDKDYVIARRMPDGSLQEALDCRLIPERDEIPIPDTQPGEVISVSVSFVTPKLPCSVISTWKMTDAGGKFCFPEFTGIWVSVRVVAL